MMQVKTLRNAVYSFGLCLLASLVSAAPYTSPRGYSLSVPPGGRVASKHAAEEDVVINFPQAAAKSQGKPVFSVTVAPRLRGFTLEQTIPSFIAAYKQGGNIIVSQTYVSINGVRGLNFVLDDDLGGQVLRIRQVSVSRGNFDYTFTSACSKKVHAEYDPIFAQILASIRWKA